MYNPDTITFLAAYGSINAYFVVCTAAFVSSVFIFLKKVDYSRANRLLINNYSSQLSTCFRT